MIGFIGCGNMGGALATAAAKALPAGEILLANRTRAKADALAAQLGACVSSNEEIARTCHYIFLGVKPQMMQDLMQTLRPILAERQDRFILVSMAAGLTARTIQEMAGSPYPIIRILPNTPAGVGKGVTQFCTLSVTEDETQEFLRIMAPSGLLDELPESLMNAANCLSGCGTAFACLFMEALADGAVACGLPRQTHQPLRGPDSRRDGYAGAGERRAVRPAQGSCLLSRGHYHPGRPRSRAGRSALCRYGGGHRRL